MSTPAITPLELKPISSILLPLGFERITMNTKDVFWKPLNEYGGRHIIVEGTGENQSQYPNWKDRFAQISIYRGPQLREQLEHREIAYEFADLEAFLHELKIGTFR